MFFLQRQILSDEKNPGEVVVSKKYDLVIVGGGPAGHMAARVAGENGHSTALLERKTDITKVRRVDGGGLVPLNEYMCGETFTFNPEAKRCGVVVRGAWLFAHLFAHPTAL